MGPEHSLRRTGRLRIVENREDYEIKIQKILSGGDR